MKNLAQRKTHSRPSTEDSDYYNQLLNKCLLTSCHMPDQPWELGMCILSSSLSWGQPYKACLENCGSHTCPGFFLREVRSLLKENKPWTGRGKHRRAWPTSKPQPPEGRPVCGNPRPPHGFASVPHSGADA